MRLAAMANFEKDQGIAVVRITVATLLGIHGIARIALGIVDDFGGFLSQVGLPLGVVWAWGVTIFELAGAVFLILRKHVVLVATFFIIELLAGIVLVHGQEGWFVVGAGRNGVEYSVLLIASLGAVILTARNDQGAV